MSIDDKWQEICDLFDAENYTEASRKCTSLMAEVEHPLVCNMLGMCHLKMGNRDLAEYIFTNGLRMDQACTPLLSNLGNMYRQDMRIKQAEDLLKVAVNTSPDDHQANHNLAVLFLETGRWQDGLDYALRANRIDPDNLASQHTLSLAYFQLGDYANGAHYYDSRKKLYMRDEITLPRYEHGKGHVIVRHEQGLGDTLMVSRWLPEIEKSGATVTMTAPQPLHKLLEDSGLCKIYKGGDMTEHKFTHHLWGMDLLQMFGRDWNGIKNTPYFRTDPEQVEKWADILGQKKSPRIGLCYSGKSRPDNLQSYQIDKRRSLSISEAHSLMSGIDAEWVNLTREMGLPDSVDYSSMVRDFSDMGALMSNLDLIVTVDTAVAHLAGGLGLPTMVLHRYDACWRWHPYTKQTQLYQNMQHFYQPNPFDWASVIEEAQNGIRAVLNH